MPLATRPTRLAWFAPLPPLRSGIAAYNAELLPLLARGYAIDVFAERIPAAPPGASPVWLAQSRPSEPPAPIGDDTPEAVAQVRVLDAHAFVWRHARDPYDLVVYQVGNEACHDYLWPYLVRYPGLVVLHDGVLHHARARALLERRRWQEYAAEFEFAHPRAVAGVADVGRLGLLGALQYFYPMLRVPVAAARVVAVHSPWLAHELAETFPGAPVEIIRMGVADPLAASSPGTRPVPASPCDGHRAADARMVVRARYGLAPDTVVFAAFGRLTPEKRLAPAVRAVAGLAARGARVHLLLVGDLAAHYDVRVDIARFGAGGTVTVTGYVSEDELPGLLLAADVCFCLRWPTARETSASWLRCLAAGKPTIATDLAHTVDIPALDPRDWSVLPAATPLPRRGSGRSLDRPSPDRPSHDALDPLAPVCIAVDILDEDHSLALAVDRLARDATLRARLGAAARAWYLEHHTLAHMVEDYRRVIDLARQRSGTGPGETRTGWPTHLVEDGTSHARALLAKIGVGVDFLDA